VEKLRMLSLRNSGQVCTLKSRLLVSERRESELLERLTALVKSMPVGDPSDPATQVGPMVTSTHRDRVEGYIQSGRDQGARLVVGGGRPRDLSTGWFVEPTVFADVAPDMLIAQEEIFGPVLAVLTYRDDDEAVEIANNSEFGLNGAVFTTDYARGLAIASRIRTGTVEINGSPTGFTAPVGGFKTSGIGREAGPEGLDAYTEPRSIGLPEDLANQLDHH
jgi:acyl-CoA reductase-like NAD-dependent aldehyde dehydrogenase